MIDLAHIRHLIHEGQWSTARAEASGDAVAEEYVKEHARMDNATPMPEIDHPDLELDLLRYIESDAEQKLGVPDENGGGAWGHKPGESDGSGDGARGDDWLTGDGGRQVNEYHATADGDGWCLSAIAVDDEGGIHQPFDGGGGWGPEHYKDWHYSAQDD